MIMNTDPKSFDEFIGQDSAKESAMRYLQAAAIRREVLGHTFLQGPSGVGKTTLVRILGKTMDVRTYETTGRELTRKG
jgi:Holliday junction DNA helicase RuvB